MSNINPPKAVLAEIDFQVGVKSTDPLPPGLDSALLTLPFPISAPPSLRYAPNYEGLKVFSYEGEWICMSRFFFRESKDEYGRSVPSSFCLVIDKALLGGGLYNLQAVYAWLAQLEALPEDPWPALVQIREESGVFVDQKSLKAALKGQEKQMAQALCQLIKEGRQTLCTEDVEEGLRFMSLMYQLLPETRRTRWTYSTFADSEQGEREEVILYPCVFEEQKKGFFQRLLGGGATSDPQRTDLSPGGGQNPISAHLERSLIYRAYWEGFFPSLTAEMAFEQRWDLLMQMIQSEISPGSSGLRKTLHAFRSQDPEFASQLEAFVQG